MQASAPAYGALGTLRRVDKSLFDMLFPSAHTGHRVLASVVLIALMFVCAKARFYLPENPTPITLQTFGVLLTGGVMGWRWGVGAVLGYIGLGALGLPMFASSDPWAFRTPVDAWNASIAGVTGGYIIGFRSGRGGDGISQPDRLHPFTIPMAGCPRRAGPVHPRARVALRYRLRVAGGRPAVPGRDVHLHARRHHQDARSFIRRYRAMEPRRAPNGAL